MIRRNKNTIADKVLAAIGDSCTFTLYGGYCLQNGVNVFFPLGSCELEKRNEKGQVSKARYIYADGSRLVYTRKPDNNFSLEVKA